MIGVVVVDTRKVIGSIPSGVKSKTIKLVFAAVFPSMYHYKNMIVCQSGSTCLPMDYWFS